MFNGSKLRTIREEQGLSIQQLSKQANISRPYLNQIELRSKEPSSPVLKRLTEALRIEVEELYDKGTKAGVETEPAEHNTPKPEHTQVPNQFTADLPLPVVIGAVQGMVLDKRANLLLSLTSRAELNMRGKLVGLETTGKYHCVSCQESVELEVELSLGHQAFFDWAVKDWTYLPNVQCRSQVTQQVIRIKSIWFTDMAAPFDRIQVIENLITSSGQEVTILDGELQQLKLVREGLRALLDST